MGFEQYLAAREDYFNYPVKLQYILLTAGMLIGYHELIPLPFPGTAPGDSNTDI